MLVDLTHISIKQYFASFAGEQRPLQLCGSRTIPFRSLQTLHDKKWSSVANFSFTALFALYTASAVMHKNALRHQPLSSSKQEKFLHAAIIKLVITGRPNT